MQHVTDLIDEKALALLRAAGKEDMVSLRFNLVTNRAEAEIKSNFPQALYDGILEGVKRSAFNDRDWHILQCMLAHDAMHRWICDGPKIVQPSIDNCEALTHVEPRISGDDYFQPYPAVLVDFPMSFRPPARALLLHLREDGGNKTLVSHLWLAKDALHGIVTCTPISNGATLEDIIFPIPINEEKQSSDCLRVAANLMLMKVNFGWKTEPLLPKEFARNRKQIEEGRPGARERAALDLRLITFKQETKLFRVVYQRATTDGSTPGHEVGPHWRGGYMRRLGIRSKTPNKLKYWRPTMVRRDKFFGDTGDTSATYK